MRNFFLQSLYRKILAKAKNQFFFPLSYKKKSFILLEILIAVALITFCTIPLLRNPLYFYKKEMTDLQNLIYISLENETLMEVKKLLLTNQIPWEEFSCRGYNQVIKRKAPSKKILIEGFKEKEVDIYYRVWTKNEKKCQDRTIARRLGVQISIEKPFKEHYKKGEISPFVHHLFAQKILKNTPKKTAR